MIIYKFTVYCLCQVQCDYIFLNTAACISCYLKKHSLIRWEIYLVFEEIHEPSRVHLQGWVQLHINRQHWLSAAQSTDFLMQRRAEPNMDSLRLLLRINHILKIITDFGASNYDVN